MVVARRGTDKPVDRSTPPDDRLRRHCVLQWSAPKILTLLQTKQWHPRTRTGRWPYFEDEEVILLIVGRKIGNTLLVENEEFHGHQVDPPESTGGGPEGDAQ
jgi:hypothetical protein